MKTCTKCGAVLSGDRYSVCLYCRFEGFYSYDIDQCYFCLKGNPDKVVENNSKISIAYHSKCSETMYNIKEITIEAMAADMRKRKLNASK